MEIFDNAKEIKPTIRKHDIVDYMFEQHVFCRMFLEVEFGKRILDFVVELVFLNKPDFALSRTDCIARARNRGCLQQTTCMSGGGNQRAALSAYRILRQRPRISASFIGTCSCKHSDTADIRKRLLDNGRDRINDSTLMSIPSR